MNLASMCFNQILIPFLSLLGSAATEYTSLLNNPNDAQLTKFSIPKALKLIAADSHSVSLANVAHGPSYLASYAPSVFVLLEVENLKTKFGPEDDSRYSAAKMKFGTEDEIRSLKPKFGPEGQASSAPEA